MHFPKKAHFANLLTFSKPQCYFFLGQVIEQLCKNYVIKRFKSF